MLDFWALEVSNLLRWLPIALRPNLEEEKYEELCGNFFHVHASEPSQARSSQAGMHECKHACDLKHVP